MDKHQSELAFELSEMGVCEACTLQEFIEHPEDLVAAAGQRKNSLPAPNFKQFNEELRALISPD